MRRAGRSRRMATVAPAQAHNGHGDVPVRGASRFHVVQGLSETSRKARPALDVVRYVLRPFVGIRWPARAYREKILPTKRSPGGRGQTRGASRGLQGRRRAARDPGAARMSWVCFETIWWHPRWPAQVYGGKIPPIKRPPGGGGAGPGGVLGPPGSPVGRP